MVTATSLRALLHAIAGDIRGAPEDKCYHPGDTRRYSPFKKLKVYCYQVLELLAPSLFFPINCGLPLDRFDEDRLFPSTWLVHRANMLDVSDESTNSDTVVSGQDMSSAQDDVSRSFECLVWKNAIKVGVSPKKQYIDAFSDTPQATSKATIWRELKDGQWDTRTMAAGMFIVGGTLARTLGFEAQPQHVSRVGLVWEERCLKVIWETERETLISVWPVINDFIFTGVADAGLAEALMSIRDLRPGTKESSRSLHTTDTVSSTGKVGEKCLRKWNTARETLPCIIEPHSWSPLAEQWRRRAMMATQQRALDELTLGLLNPWLYYGDSKAPFQGMGAFLAEPGIEYTTEVTPKPALSIAPIVLEEDTWHTGFIDAFRVLPRFSLVQKSVIDKWKYSSKPRRLPTLLCDIENDFLPVSPTPGSDYLAISHRWGQLPANILKDKVRQVAKELQVRYAWVDIWCISDDPHEKAVEIAKMGDYYSYASAVVVVLPEVKSRTAYTNLRNGTPFDLHKTRKRNAGLAKEIVDSEWRSRVWTIQEAQLAQICVVTTQHQILDGEFLDHLLHVPYHCRSAKYAVLGHIFHAGSPIVNVRGVWNAYELKGYSCTFGSRQWWSAGHHSSASGPPSKTGLLEALKLAEGHSCSMPLDYVIGLLGMVDGRIPPLNAQVDTWKTIWTKLQQSGIAHVEMLRSQSVCEEHAMCWAPGPISKDDPLKVVGMSGEIKEQHFRLVDDGLELLGTPLDVVVGREVEDDDQIIGSTIPGLKRIIITIGGDRCIKTVAQVFSTTGTKFAGVALAPERGDKGVLVLLGEWTDITSDTMRFHRYTSMNVVKTRQLLEVLEETQSIIVGIDS